MAKSIGINTWLHRTTKQYLEHISGGGMLKLYPAEVFSDGLGDPISNANWIHAPDLSAVTGQPSKYWTITGDAVTLMTAGEMAAVDAAELAASRDAITAQLDEVEYDLRAFMLVVLDEFNDHTDRTNAILDAIDTANNLATLKSDVALIQDLPVRTVLQLRTGVRNKLGS